MSHWTEIVGKSFTADEFDAYCKAQSWGDWKPSFVAVHNTCFPDLAMRPHGFTAKHMDNIAAGYKEKKWSAGPHLFIDDHKIGVFTPLDKAGVHSPSWNKTALGVEMLGDYSKDSFSSGRGLAVRRNTVRAVASLSRRLGLSPDTIRFHKEDKASTHDECPGKNVKKEEFVAEVRAAIAA